MGYYINFKGCDFRIPKENFEPALKAIKAAAKKKMGGVKAKHMASYGHWSWIDMDVVLKAKTLDEFLEEARWSPEHKDGKADEDIISVTFDGEKLGSEGEWMSVLAPFVQTGSWIEVSGEEDAIWRWVFRNGTLEEESAHIEWEDWEGMLNAVLEADKKDLPKYLGLRPDLDVVLSKYLNK
jgi:hypothetical protein